MRNLLTNCGNEFRLSISGIVISMTFDECNHEFSIDDSHKRFFVDHRPEVTLNVHCHNFSMCRLEQKIFDSGSFWSLYRSNERLILYLHELGPARLPFLQASLEPDLRSGDIYIKPMESGDRRDPYPLELLLQILVLNLLSLNRGLLLHACGINDQGLGIIFCGASGTGKSTIATLYQHKKGVTILGDDRIIVRRLENRFLVYGTPWNKNPQLSSPENVPLDKVFFIKQGSENIAVRKISTKTVIAFLLHSYPPFWDPFGVKCTLQLISELNREVSCYELSFVADESLLDFVRRVR